MQYFNYRIDDVFSKEESSVMVFQMGKKLKTPLLFHFEIKLSTLQLRNPNWMEAHAEAQSNHGDVRETKGDGRRHSVFPISMNQLSQVICWLSCNIVGPLLSPLALQNISLSKFSQ